MGNWLPLPQAASATQVEPPAAAPAEPPAAAPAPRPTKTFAEAVAAGRPAATTPPDPE